jgi:hypothetical protein
MVTADASSRAFNNERLIKLGVVLSACLVKPFLVTLSRTPRHGDRMTVHVSRECVKPSWSSLSRPLARDFARRVSALGFDGSVRVKLHSRSALDSPQSIEAFVAALGLGERIYDPTGAFAEAENLLGFACEVRRKLPRQLKGIYWSARWRTTFVLLDRTTLSDELGLTRDRLIAAENAVLDAHEISSGGSRADSTGRPRLVRLCFDLPGMPLVPVDDASIGHVGKSRMGSLLTERTWLSRMPVLGAVLSLFPAGMATAALPADNGPAQPSLSASASGASGSVAGQSDGARRIATASAVESPGSFAGGPGLHSLWRDSVHGAAGQSPSVNDPVSTEACAAAGGTVTPEQFAELAKSGATFGARTTDAGHGSLDVSWQSKQESAVRGPVMQPGVAAVIGLSGLMQGGESEVVYRAALEDVEMHFGLPRSLQVETSWHFERTTGHEDGVREWLGRIGSNEAGNGIPYWRNFNKVLEAKTRHTRGSSS